MPHCFGRSGRRSARRGFFRRYCFERSRRKIYPADAQIAQGTVRSYGGGHRSRQCHACDFVTRPCRCGRCSKNLRRSERQQLSRRHQLNALLGLAPDAPLPLAGASEVPRVDAQRIRRNFVSSAHRRPDLIALQYGYRSEDAKLRQAILAQFPNVTIGLAGDATAARFIRLARKSRSIFRFSIVMREP